MCVVNKRMPLHARISHSVKKFGLEETTQKSVTVDLQLPLIFKCLLQKQLGLSEKTKCKRIFLGYV